MDEYVVYVRVNSEGIIVAINSSEFLTNTSDWIMIDRGVGDRYHHAQNSYLSYDLIDSNGIYNYKMVDGKPELRTTEEKSSELERIIVEQEISQLKAKLAATDYISVKIAEGAATREEYVEQIAQRAAWRTRINELEGT